MKRFFMLVVCVVLVLATAGFSAESDAKAKFSVYGGLTWDDGSMGPGRRASGATLGLMLGLQPTPNLVFGVDVGTTEYPLYNAQFKPQVLGNIVVTLTTRNSDVSFHVLAAYGTVKLFEYEQCANFGFMLRFNTSDRFGVFVMPRYFTIFGTPSTTLTQVLVGFQLW